MNQSQPARLKLPAVPHSVFGTGHTNEFDHERWRSQHDVVRDILLSAAQCGTWLTLAELATLTRFPEPSIAAQMRAMRTSRRGGYIIAKRRRAPARSDSPGPGGPRRLAIM